MSEFDALECHQVSGKIEGERLYTHFKYNMVRSVKVSKNGTIGEQIQLKVDPEETGTSMYSDG